jgi:KWG repeat domain protein
MRVQRDGKWGFLLEDGKTVVPCAYDRIDEPDANGRIPVMNEGKWGLLSPTGEPFIPCIYDLIREPNQYGLFPVANDDKHGFLDSLGRETLPSFFTYISGFKDGFARMNYGGNRVFGDEPRGGLWGLIDSLGHEAVPCRYYYLATPAEGLAAFRLEQFGDYGYIDMKGNVAIAPRYSVARPFNSGVAVVSYNNVNLGLIDRNGNEISSFRYKLIGRFNDGLAPFNTSPYSANFMGMAPRCGYLDTEGREALPARWDDAAEFSEMRAAVMRLGNNPDDFYEARWGYIATSGQLVIPYKYHEAHPFSCGRARVFIRGLGYGYIDRKGEEIVPCKYQEAEDFRDFRARVTQYDRVMTIDENGQEVGEE